MKRTLLIPVLLVLSCAFACSEPAAGGESPAAVPAPTPNVVTDSRVAMDLGREFCGGCVAGVRKTLSSVPGVGTVDYTEGAPTFVVHYDSTKITAERILELVRAGGEAKAAIKS